MLDLKQIRSDPSEARAALSRRGAADDLDELLRLDERRRDLLPGLEEMRAERNEASDAIGLAKREGRDADAEIAAMRELGERIKAVETELAEVETARDDLAARLPNLPHADAPEGETDEDAVALREVGAIPEFEFEPRDHLEIAQAAGLIEMEKAAEASGARFAYLLGDLVLAELALIRYAVDMVTSEGFTPVVPPVLVR